MHKVALAWRDGRPAKAGNFWTDGRNIYSYQLAIGYTAPSRPVPHYKWNFDTSYPNSKVAFRFQAPDHYISMTTSHHVGRALAVANEAIAPPPGHGYSARRGVCQGVCEHIYAAS